MSAAPATRMDFFDRQDLARRHTFRLVVLFILAVIMIVAAVNLTAFGVMRANEVYSSTRRQLHRARSDEFNLEPRTPMSRRPSVYGVVTLITLGVIGAGSLYKTLMLSSGGPAVAQLLGGRLVLPAAEHPEEQTLRNVVEEMAIASGVPVPQIFV